MTQRPASNVQRPTSNALGRNLRLLLFILLLALTSHSQAVPQDPYDSISAEMNRYVVEGKVAGVVTMVIKDGEPVHEHATGFRDIESSDKLDVSDLFRIASQSKAVTSVAAMILVEEGKLALDDRVSRYIPEFANTLVAEVAEVAEVSEAAGATQGVGGVGGVGGAGGANRGYRFVPADRQITIRDLLTHTSGMSYGFGPARQAYAQVGILGWYLAGRDETIQETARKLASLPLTIQPGSDWVYGYSTDVLGAVVEIASGHPLDEYFQDRIFDPLGMVDTHFFIPESKADRLVTVYGLIEEELKRMPDGEIMQSQGQYLSGPRACFSGGAGLVSTAFDYTRFQLMLLNGGSMDGHQILSAESVAEMTNDQVGDLYDGDKNGFGLAFRIEGENSDGPEPPGTLSWGGAYHSHYWIDPANNLVGIILTQLIPAAGSDIRQRFKQLVYEVLED